VCGSGVLLHHLGSNIECVLAIIHLCHINYQHKVGLGIEFGLVACADYCYYTVKCYIMYQ